MGNTIIKSANNQKQLIITRQKHAQLQKRFQWFPGLIPPLYDIELYNNRVVVHYKDKTGRQQSIDHSATTPFSNSRLVVADFHAAHKAMQTALAKRLPLWFAVKGLAVVDVKETLTDGLTPIEAKVIREVVYLASKSKLAKVYVTYQQDKVF